MNCKCTIYKSHYQTLNFQQLFARSAKNFRKQCLGALNPVFDPFKKVDKSTKKH
jgi:hypothetical protein